jgi:hypothetical protein
LATPTATRGATTTTTTTTATTTATKTKKKTTTTKLRTTTTTRWAELLLPAVLVLPAALLPVQNAPQQGLL